MDDRRQAGSTHHFFPSGYGPCHAIDSKSAAPDPQSFSIPVENFLRAYWNDITDHQNHPETSDAKTLIPQCAIGEETYLQRQHNKSDQVSILRRSGPLDLRQEKSE
jgi:hypothetical protein